MKSVQFKAWSFLVLLAVVVSVQTFAKGGGEVVGGIDGNGKQSR